MILQIVLLNNIFESSGVVLYFKTNASLLDLHWLGTVKCLKTCKLCQFNFVN